MDSDDLRDCDAAGPAVVPRIVLVQQGVVKDTYGPRHWDGAEAAALWLVDRHGSPVTIYGVDAMLPPPPPPGTRVAHPLALGWIELGRESVLSLPISGRRYRREPPHDAR